MAKKTKKDPNVYPKGWDAARVRAVIAHVEGQTEDEAIAEADAAYENSRMTLIAVPNEVAEEVREFIAARRHARAEEIEDARDIAELRNAIEENRGGPSVSLEEVRRQLGLKKPKRITRTRAVTPKRGVTPRATPSVKLRIRRKAG